VLAADADRRAIERDLHDGVQQQLVSLAVNLQQASASVEGDPVAAKELLDRMAHDVQQALDEAARLAQRIYPPLLEARGLAAALRAAAVSAGVRASVEVAPGLSCAPEVAGTIYQSWLEALGHAGDDAPAAVSLREDEGALTFELVADFGRSDPEFVRLRDRVAALGGRLTIRSEPGGGTRVVGSLPLSR
jgi:signal transduction histidine kinase